MLSRFFLGVLFIVVCFLGGTVKGEEDKIRVLVWNVWRGTNKVDQGAEKALALIKETKADLCLLQESYDIEGPRGKFGPWAAEKLGWESWQGKSPHLCVITRYKVKKSFFHADWHGLGVELEDDKGRELHAFSIWIDYRSPIGKYLMKNPEASDAEVLQSETKRSGRTKQAQAILDYLRKEKLLGMETPLLVGGDWNCPSHLDWTAAVAKEVPYRRPLELPVSKMMKKANFSDTFRMVHPDPLKVQGNTWSPLFRKADGVDQPMNRIDRLYYKSNLKKPKLKPVKATVYPEVLEDEEIPVRQRKFPSDHAAVLIEFDWVE